MPLLGARSLLLLDGTGCSVLRRVEARVCGGRGGGTILWRKACMDLQAGWLKEGCPRPCRRSWRQEKEGVCGGIRRASAY